MTCSHDSLPHDTAPDTPPTHGSGESRIGHPPERVTVSVRVPVTVAGTVSHRAGRSIRRGDVSLAVAHMP